MEVITVGKRLIPADQIALVEIFDPASNPEFKPEREFKGRIVLLNRDTVLTEMTPQEFAVAHHLRLLADDHVAVGQSVAFKVETFAPTESFQPKRPYVTRIKWRDETGNEQSKLLLTPPETVVGELSLRRAKVWERPNDGSQPLRRATRRKTSRKSELRS